MARADENDRKTGDRDKRLADALRENLRRRKEQAARRAADAPRADSGLAAKNSEDD
jgi:hypothetical protein